MSRVPCMAPDIPATWQAMGAMLWRPKCPGPWPLDSRRQSMPATDMLMLSRQEASGPSSVKLRPRKHGTRHSPDLYNLNGSIVLPLNFQSLQFRVNSSFPLQVEECRVGGTHAFVEFRVRDQFLFPLLETVLYPT
jgi:hypothetical protein